MVIKVNDLSLHDLLGATAHHPRWAIAYKFSAQQGQSKLKAIDFQVGRTGAITPVAKIDPVNVGGVTVTSVSMFNEEFIQEKDIRVGDVLIIERAGDVIPYISRVRQSKRSNESKPIKFPRQCPVCQTDLKRSEEEVAWRCVNDACEAKMIARIKHFVSKNAMDIEGMGSANIARFYEKGMIKKPEDIYQLDIEKISKMEGFGERSAENLKEAIKVSKKQPLHRLLFALGIKYIGETTAKALIKEIDKLEDLASLSEEQLLQLHDIGPKVTKSLISYFEDEENIKCLKKLRELGLSLDNNQEARENLKWNAKTFLFTGSLKSLNRYRAKELVEKYGGTVLSGVSTRLDYLVVGEKAGSKLKKAKAIDTISIISEDEFLRMCEE